MGVDSGRGRNPTLSCFRSDDCHRFHVKSERPAKPHWRDGCFASYAASAA